MSMYFQTRPTHHSIEIQYLFYLSRILFEKSKMMQLKEINVDEIYKRDKLLKKEEVVNVMKWVEFQSHLPNLSVSVYTCQCLIWMQNTSISHVLNLSRKQMFPSVRVLVLVGEKLCTALFLHSCYYNNELAKTTIDIHHTVKTLCPDIFGNRSPRDPQVKLTIDSFFCSPLPQLTDDGTLVILAKVLDVNPGNFIFPVILKCFDMITLFHMHQNGPPNGVIIVFDMEGITFSHFLRVSVVVMKKFLYYLQEGMPIRLKGLHFCNVVSFIDKLIAMMKPFLKEEILRVLGLHIGMDTVYELISKNIFPQDYGGSAESIEILHEKVKARINDNEEFFKYQESQVVDESKRPGKPMNVSDIFGMEGTFKRLEVD
ncbi:alpha-tocopherol transfer protein isoform X2 [Leptinotarsa decemlineata]|uniref:alpha-tocopherol transfer protein isoform X2 n=1 Tax=Leptinotarsa decemlineata TaxID=7539 RepID=UPI003D304B0E